MQAMSPRDRAGLSDSARIFAVGERELVDLVEEDDHGRVARLGQQVAQALGIALDRAREGGDRHVEDANLRQRRGHLAGGDALGEALDDRGLARTGRPEQHGIALGLAQQHLRDGVDLALAPDDGGQGAGLRQRHQVAPEPVERRGRRGARLPDLGRADGVGRVHGLAAGDDRLGHRLLEQVDRLVREAAVGDALLREFEQDVDGVVGDGRRRATLPAGRGPIARSGGSGRA